MDKEQQSLTGRSATIQNMSSPLNLRMWVKENDCAGVKWCLSWGLRQLPQIHLLFIPLLVYFQSLLGLWLWEGMLKSSCQAQWGFPSWPMRRTSRTRGKGRAVGTSTSWLTGHTLGWGAAGQQKSQSLPWRLSCLQLKAEDDAPFPRPLCQWQRVIPAFELGKRRWSSDSTSLGTPNNAIKVSHEQVMSEDCLPPKHPKTATQGMNLSSEFKEPFVSFSCFPTGWTIPCYHSLWHFWSSKHVSEHTPTSSYEKDICHHFLNL